MRLETATYSVLLCVKTRYILLLVCIFLRRMVDISIWLIFRSLEFRFALPTHSTYETISKEPLGPKDVPVSLNSSKVGHNDFAEYLFDRYLVYGNVL